MYGMYQRKTEVKDDSKVLAWAIRKLLFTVLSETVERCFGGESVKSLDLECQ